MILTMLIKTKEMDLETLQQRLKALQSAPLEPSDWEAHLAYWDKEQDIITEIEKAEAELAIYRERMAIEPLKSEEFKRVRGALEKEAAEERDLDTQAEGYSKEVEDTLMMIEKEIANDTEIMSEMHADYISAVTMLMELTVDDVATVKQDIATRL